MKSKGYIYIYKRMLKFIIIKKWLDDFGHIYSVCVTCNYWKSHDIFASVCRHERNSTIIVCEIIKCTIGTECDT